MEKIYNQGISSILFLVLPLLGAIINAILLLCIQRNPLGCFRNSSSYLVAHQAFSDMITCSFIAGYYIATLCDGSIANVFPTVAKIFIVLSVTGFIALFLVSLDRFLAIRFPIHYRVHVKCRLLPMIIVPLWLGTLAASLLVVFKPRFGSSISMVLLALGGVLVFIKLCLHCLAFWAMKKKDSEIRRNNSQSSSSNNGQTVALKRERRFLLTVFLITVVVLVTAVPILCYFYRHGTVDSVWSYHGMAVFIFYWLGGILGPSIYFLRLNSYYSSLKKIVCL